MNSVIKDNFQPETVKVLKDTLTRDFRSEIVKKLKDDSNFLIDDPNDKKKTTNLDYDKIVKKMETENLENNEDKKNQILLDFLNEYQTVYYDHLNDTQKQNFSSILDSENPISNVWIAMKKIEKSLVDKVTELEDLYKLKISYDAFQMKNEYLTEFFSKFEIELKKIEEIFKGYNININESNETVNQEEYSFYKKYLNLIFFENQRNIVISTFFSVLNPVRVYFQKKVKDVLVSNFKNLNTVFQRLKITTTKFFTQLELDEKKKNEKKKEEETKEKEKTKNDEEIRTKKLEKDLKLQKKDYNYFIFYEMKNEFISKEDLKSIFKSIGYYDEHLKREKYVLWKKNNYPVLKKQIEDDDFLNVKGFKEFRICSLYFFYLKNLTLQTKKIEKQLESGEIKKIHFKTNHDMSKTNSFRFLKKYHDKIHSDDVDKLISFENLFDIFGFIVYGINNILNCITLSKNPIYRLDALLRKRYEIQNFSLIENFGDVLKEGITFLKIKNYSDINLLIPLFKSESILNYFSNGKIHYMPFDFQFKLLLFLLCFSHMKSLTSYEFKNNMNLLIENPHNFIRITGLEKNKKPQDTETKGQGSENKKKNSGKRKRTNSDTEKTKTGKRKKKSSDTKKTKTSSSPEEPKTKKVKNTHTAIKADRQRIFKRANLKYKNSVQKNYLLMAENVIPKYISMSPEEHVAFLEDNYNRLQNDPSKSNFTPEEIPIPQEDIHRRQENYNRLQNNTINSKGQNTSVEKNKEPLTVSEDWRSALADRIFNNIKSLKSVKLESLKYYSDNERNEIVEDLFGYRIKTSITLTDGIDTDDIVKELQKLNHFVNDITIESHRMLKDLFNMTEKFSNYQEFYSKLSFEFNSSQFQRRNPNFLSNYDTYIKSINCEKNVEPDVKAIKSVINEIKEEKKNQLVETITILFVYLNDVIKTKYLTIYPVLDFVYRDKKNDDSIGDKNSFVRVFINKYITESEHLDEGPKNIYSDLNTIWSRYIKEWNNMTKTEDKKEGLLNIKEKPLMSNEDVNLATETIYDLLKSKYTTKEMLVYKDKKIISEKVDEKNEDDIVRSVFYTYLFLLYSNSVLSSYHILNSGKSDRKKHPDLDLNYEFSKAIKKFFDKMPITNIKNDIKLDTPNSYVNSLVNEENVFVSRYASVPVLDEEEEEKEGVGQKKTEEGVRQKKTEEVVEQKKTEEGAGQKKTEEIKHQNPAEKEVGYQKLKAEVKALGSDAQPNLTPKRSIIQGIAEFLWSSVIKGGANYIKNLLFSLIDWGIRKMAWAPKKIAKIFNWIPGENTMKVLNQRLSTIKKRIDLIKKRAEKNKDLKPNSKFDTTVYEKHLNELNNYNLEIGRDIILKYSGENTIKSIGFGWMATVSTTLYGIFYGFYYTIVRAQVIGEQFLTATGKVMAATASGILTGTGVMTSQDQAFISWMFTTVNIIFSWKFYFLFAGTGALLLFIFFTWGDKILDFIYKTDDDFRKIMDESNGIVKKIDELVKLLDSEILRLEELDDDDVSHGDGEKLGGDGVFTRMLKWTGLKSSTLSKDEIFKKRQKKYLENSKNNISEENSGNTMTKKQEKQEKKRKKMSKKEGKKEKKDGNKNGIEKKSSLVKYNNNNGNEETKILSSLNNLQFKNLLKKLSKKKKELKKELKNYVFTEFSDDCFNEKKEIEEGILKFDKIKKKIHSEMILFKKMIEKIGSFIGKEKILVELYQEKISTNNKQKVKDFIEKYELGNLDNPVEIFFIYKKMHPNNLTKWVNNIITDITNKQKEKIKKKIDFCKQFEEYVEILNNDSNSPVFKLNQYLNSKFIKENSNENQLLDKLIKFNELLNYSIISIYKKYSESPIYLEDFNDFKSITDTDINLKTSEFLKNLTLDIKKNKIEEHNKKITYVSDLYDYILNGIENEFNGSELTKNHSFLNKDKKNLALYENKHKKRVIYPSNSIFNENGHNRLMWKGISPQIFLPKLGYYPEKPWYYDYLYRNRFQGHTPLYLPHDIPYYVRRHIHDREAIKDKYLIKLLKSYRRKKNIKK